MDFRPCFSPNQTCFHFSPPTEASIKSFIYHSVPDILDSDSSRTDLREHAPVTSGIFFNFWTPLSRKFMQHPLLDLLLGTPLPMQTSFKYCPSSSNGMTPTPTYSPQKMPLLRAISMYPCNHRIWKKSDASHKYVTRYSGDRL